MPNLGNPNGGNYRALGSIYKGAAKNVKSPQYTKAKVGKAQVKPLGQVQPQPKPKKSFNENNPAPKTNANVLTPHSSHNSIKSQQYHDTIVGKMNPTKRIKASRSFPGLANGE
jgi:hypothetical protein